MQVFGNMNVTMNLQLDDLESHPSSGSNFATLSFNLVEPQCHKIKEPN